ncbi:hypothetical protein D3C80_1796620 [compost metagenome]
MIDVVRVDREDIRRRRSGKVDGYIPEVRRGVGSHTPKAFKKKEKDSWKRQVREYY